MPAYHSQYNEGDYPSICNLALVPLNAQYKGPAPKTDGPDIIDEAFQYFKPNMFFQSFTIEGPADRVLIYLIMFIRECIVKSQKCPNAAEARKTLNTFALSNFSIPGDSKFPLNNLYPAPASRQDGDQLKQYLTQLRVETADRFCKIAFANDQPNKWWFSFGKKKFLNQTID